MKLKFVEQQYQNDAVNSIVDIFDGCQQKESLFTVDISKGKDGASVIEGVGSSYVLGHSNSKNMTISYNEMLDNVRKIQENNDIPKTDDLMHNNFTVEMETGTGKTYVYTQTILELNKKYGFTKFIIVVPSIAIKEGVFKSLQVTEEHFKLKYDNLNYNYFVYNSNSPTDIMRFATASNIEIMIINIDAFRKSFEDPTKENKANLIHRPSEKLSGNKPIDLIKSTNPIVIIDEPQSVDNTKKSKDAIASLNPLCIFRYSATHKEMYNLVYRLTPVDACEQHLVKTIEVSSVQSDDQSTKAYIKLLGVDTNPYKAKLEIFVKNKDGAVEKKVVTAKMKSDLWDLSKEVEYYQGSGYIVTDINAEYGYEDISFANGIYLNKGESVGEVDEEAIKRAQIKETIEVHLSKELSYIKKGIKVLSLFFIDKVANYRDYESEDDRGKYAVWFEEEYEKLINTPRYSRLKQEFPNICFDAASIHTGYFSQDKKGRLVDTKGDTDSDNTTYELIMKKKEELLDLKNPIRFIFSHSALKEGWDNPNVFQVCTLIETKDTFTKRQKIGRGLRIAVDQNGERVMDHKFNSLTVVANESYKSFAENLQKELADVGYKFGLIEPVSFKGISVTKDNGESKELSQDDSEKLFKAMQDKGYIDKKGKATQKFFEDNEKGEVVLPEEYVEFAQKICKKIEGLSKTVPIKERKQQVKVSRNNKVINSDVFQAMWSKICRKTIYSIHLQLDEMKALAVEYIKAMPAIESEKIRRQRVKLNLEKSGVKVGTASEKELADISDFDTNPTYPDFIRRLQESTDLMRGTIIDIIIESGRLKDFYVNPELFIKNVSQAIEKAKKEKLVDGIEYHKLDNDFYKVEEIFDDTELYGYKDENIIDLSEPDKNPFDHVIFDSAIERQFAEDCDNDDEVKLFAKLPSGFKIDTPFGGYNPDWMVVLQREGEEHKLYFVAETKGSTDYSQVRASEKNKILCGRRHFEVVDNEVKYELVKALTDLKSQK